MRLWFVDASRWGIDWSIVRAETIDDARRLAGDPNGDVHELEVTGVEAVIWNYEHSPDSRPDSA